MGPVPRQLTKAARRKRALLAEQPEPLTPRLALHFPAQNNILYPDEYPSSRPNTCATVRLSPISSATMARVYADVNQNMPRAYWDYDSVNISELSGSVQPYPRYACWQSRACACSGRFD